MLMRGDCLELMPRLRNQSVHLMLCDPPYGVTDCEWDRKIPQEGMWAEYLRLLKPNGVIAMFAQQPFATELAAPVRKLLRYDWVWDKHAVTGFANAKKMPLRRHENVLIFYHRLPTYHPQGLRPCRPRTHKGQSPVYGAIDRSAAVQRMTGYPQSIIAFKRDRGSVACQKPVEMLEYLIRTYTNAGDLVLDNAMGTGSTGVAAVNAGRRFVGIEIDPERFRIADKRIAEAWAARECRKRKRV